MRIATWVGSYYLKYDSFMRKFGVGGSVFFYETKKNCNYYCCCGSCFGDTVITEYLFKRHDFNFLSDQFVPVFNDVNEQLGNSFYYKDAFYSGGNLYEYSLEYSGEDSDFLDKSIEFCNMFSAGVMSGKHDAVRLNEQEYIIRIKSSSLYLNCWYSKNSNSLTASTNTTDNCAIFETLKGINKLTVVTKNFTEELREYAKSFQDKCLFEVVFSDNMPW